jgi:hypothetical protein
VVVVVIVGAVVGGMAGVGVVASDVVDISVFIGSTAPQDERNVANIKAIDNIVIL